MSAIKYYTDMFRFKNLDRITIAAFLVVAQLFVLLSANHLWESEAVHDVFLIYFIMMAFSFAVLGSKNPFYKITIFDGLTQLFLAFIVGVFLFSKMGFAGTYDLSGYENLGLLIIAEALVIGLVEESMFRGALPVAFEKSHVSPGTARLLAAVSFSLFHVWVYQFDMTSLITAFVFALVMQYIWDGGSNTRRIGYPLAACGIHAAWNTVVIAGSFSLWPIDFALLGGII